MYDAIVIGARCAGSPTAMLLCRKGYRVLVIDRATFPSDTISTHFLWPMGASYLNRWGLLDALLTSTPSWDTFTGTLEGIVLRGGVPLEAIRRRLQHVHGDDSGAVNVFSDPRRRILDALLLDAAARAGAEIRQGFLVEELLQEGGRVVGIRGRQRGGGAVTERARVVIGADGRHSFVAHALELPKLKERPKCTFAYWSYYSGLSMEGLHMPLHQRGRLKLAFARTNDGLSLMLIFGPAEWFNDFRRDVEGNFLKVIEFVSPEVAERLRSCRREERFYGTADQPNYYRAASGPGWALVGDAAYMKDQCTALGMTHAFRGVELLVVALHEGLSGQRPLDDALADYSRRHIEAAEGYFDFISTQAEMNVAPRGELQLALAMRGNPQHIDRFICTFGDVLSAAEFFAPESIGQIVQAAKETSYLYPIFQHYETKLEEYNSNPFV